jgi:hypothetical protein
VSGASLGMRLMAMIFPGGGLVSRKYLCALARTGGISTVEMEERGF